ncbi:MAG: DUF6146 family protein [Bacteroidales bacterium]|nr:DUF6146 family protein [Bacteroidales bacterium]
MKDNKIIPLIILGLSFAALQISAQPDTLRFDSTGMASDSVEYQLIVFDPGYETYLLSQPQMEYYSQEYYEFWNHRYVTEWNLRHSQSLLYGDIYETYIDYNRNTDYGLELNYRLYYYFRFFEQEYGVDLLPEKVF